VRWRACRFAQQWIDAFPGATSYACPGLRQLHPEILFKESVGRDNTTPPGWPKEVRCQR